MRSFRHRFHVYGCQLTRDRLVAVWETVTKDASDRAIKHVSTTQGIGTVRESTLDELLAELGAPARLSELEFHIFDPAGQGAGSEQDRSVHVLVDVRSTFVVVSGPDETWVLGRAEELRRLLLGTRRRFAGSFRLPVIVASWFLTVALLPVDFVGFLTKVHRAVLLALTATAIGLSLALWRWLSRRNATRIVLTGDRREPWSRADWIASGILVVTVLSLAVIAYQTWGSKP